MSRIFNVKGVLTEDTKRAHVESAMSRGLPVLEPTKFKHGTMYIACYGWSLANTWLHLAGKHPLMTVSGAHDFLLDGMIYPDFHAECDPRPHKADLLNHPRDDVQYLLSSVCHPNMFDKLQGKNVKVWHQAQDSATRAWVAENAPDSPLIGGGSNVGMRAIELAAALGYKKLVIHGMDCSFDGFKRHAGSHPNENERTFLVRIGGKEFWTSPQLYEAAREFIMLTTNHDIQVTLHGDGLCAAMVREALKLRRAA